MRYDRALGIRVWRWLCCWFCNALKRYSDLLNCEIIIVSNNLIFKYSESVLRSFYVANHGRILQKIDSRMRQTCILTMVLPSTSQETLNNLVPWSLSLGLCSWSNPTHCLWYWDEAKSWTHQAQLLVYEKHMAHAWYQSVLGHRAHVSTCEHIRTNSQSPSLIHFLAFSQRCLWQLQVHFSPQTYSKVYTTKFYCLNHLNDVVQCN